MRYPFDPNHALTCSSPQAIRLVRELEALEFLQRTDDTCPIDEAARWRVWCELCEAIVRPNVRNPDDVRNPADESGRS